MAEDSALIESKETLPREANKTNDSTFDRIYKYIHNSKSRLELTEEETTIYNRWEKAWLLLCRNRTRNAVARLLIKLFNVSQATAYDDVRNAMNLFSDPREDVKAAKRAIAEDNYLKGAEKAWKSNDLEMHKKYMDSYSKINGLEIDKEDGGLAELMKKLPPQQIILNFKKEDLEGAAEVLREQITDIEHEEV